MTVRIETLTGAALVAALASFADLRIAVFRDFPYLYDGDAEYERGYLNTYAQSPGALIVGACDGTRLVGAATATPMADHADAPELTSPFTARGMDVNDICYFGESVLLPAYRGQGVGHAFFDRREAHARAKGLTMTCFCAVVRPEDHPDRPMDYSPLESFWRGRGYTPVDGLVGNFAWKDMADTEESDHPMQYWMRHLS